EQGEGEKTGSQSGDAEAKQAHHSPSPPSHSNVSVEQLFGDDNASDSEASSASPVESVVLEDSTDAQEEEQGEQYEVERIISRTVTVDGTVLYHVKWVGYEISSDPENFVEEKDMHCDQLIKEFEQLERLKKKQRAKRLKEKAESLRIRKLEAEQRKKDVNAFFASKFSSEMNAIDENSCEVIDMCSSPSSSDDESSAAQSSSQGKSRPGKHAETESSTKTSAKAKEDKKLPHHRKTPAKGQRDTKDSERPHSKKSEKKQKKPKKIIITSSSSEDESEEQLQSDRSEENRVRSERTPSSEASSSSSSVRSETDMKAHSVPHRKHSCDDSEKPSCPVKDSTDAKNKHEIEGERHDTNGQDDDPYGGFKFVRRETDGFRKGYKVSSL
ncbi:chromo' (CHRromatin Organization MOdifier) domain protein, partial [Oesophagostomum dentatum]